MSPARSAIGSVLFAVVSGIALGVGALLGVDLLRHPKSLVGTLGGSWLASRSPWALVRGTQASRRSPAWWRWRVRSPRTT